VHSKNILIYILQDATLHSLFYLETALHVSGGTVTARAYKPCFLLSFLIFMTMIIINIFTILLLLFTVLSNISPFLPSLRLPVGYSLEEGTSYFFSKTSKLALGTTLSPTHCVQSAVLLG
jgi:hypothetical protein